MSISRLTGVAMIALLATTACSNAASIVGRWNMTKGPMPGLVATFGKHTWTFSTGASGTYEISKGFALLNGDNFGGAFQIEGNKLVGAGDTIEFVRRGPNDNSPIATDPLLSHGTQMPNLGPLPGN